MTDEEKKLNEAIKQDGIETQSEILDELKRRYPQYAEHSPNEQEIERILKIMHSGIFLTHSDCAIALVNAGIGDKKQAVKDALEKLKEEIHNSCAHIEIDKFAAIPSYAIPESAIDKAIDDLFTELYGVYE